MSEEPQTIFGVDLDLPEEVEVAVTKAAEALAEVMTLEEFTEIALPILLKDEERVRKKFRPDSAVVRALDEYHEKVKMGLRNPVTY